MNPYFTVVITTSGLPATLQNCLGALQQQQLPRDQFEVVVVDEANSEEMARLVAAFCQSSRIETRYLGQARSRGRAAALNRGWRAARGRYIAFTDEDCLPQPGWLLAAQRMFLRGAQVIAGPVRTPQPTRRQGQRVLTGNVPERAEFLSANCFCQPEALQRAGGFDESADLSRRVDTDMQFKLLDIGVPISKCPEALVVRPYRARNRYAALAKEQQTRYDALLYKRHPDLFQQRMPRDEGLSLRYYATLVSLASTLASAALGNLPTLLFSLCIYLGLTIWLAANHWSESRGAGTWQGVKETGLTALAAPLLSIFWRVYGSVKYRVMYL